MPAHDLESLQLRHCILLGFGTSLLYMSTRSKLCARSSRSISACVPHGSHLIRVIGLEYKRWSNSGESQQSPLSLSLVLFSFSSYRDSTHSRSRSIRIKMSFLVTPVLLLSAGVLQASAQTSRVVTFKNSCANVGIIPFLLPSDLTLSLTGCLVLPNIRSSWKLQCWMPPGFIVQQR